MSFIVYILLTGIVGITLWTFVMQITKSECQFYVFAGLIFTLGALFLASIAFTTFWIDIPHANAEFNKGMQELAGLYFPVCAFVCAPGAFIMAFLEYRKAKKSKDSQPEGDLL